jgi:hypothetical protein
LLVLPAILVIKYSDASLQFQQPSRADGELGQALQEILDDDEDIAAMYLGRKAAAKLRAARHAEEPTSASQDDELLVAGALVCMQHMPAASSVSNVNQCLHTFGAWCLNVFTQAAYVPGYDCAVLAPLAWSNLDVHLVFNGLLIEPGGGGCRKGNRQLW